MTKIAVEDQGLVEQIKAYLELNDVDVPEDAPIHISLPGSVKTPRKCASGSGLMTSGGNYAPGYDAKLKSALYNIARSKPEKVPAELLPHEGSDVVGPMYIPIAEWTPEKAVEAIKKLNWPEPVPPKPKAEKKVKEEGDEDASTNSDGEHTSTSTKAGRKRAAAKADKEAKEAASEEETVNA